MVKKRLMVLFAAITAFNLVADEVSVVKTTKSEVKIDRDELVVAGLATGYLGLISGMLINNPGCRQDIANGVSLIAQSTLQAAGTVVNYAQSGISLAEQGASLVQQGAQNAVEYATPKVAAAGTFIADKARQVGSSSLIDAKNAIIESPITQNLVQGLTNAKDNVQASWNSCSDMERGCLIAAGIYASLMAVDSYNRYQRDKCWDKRDEECEEIREIAEKAVTHLDDSASKDDKLNEIKFALELSGYQNIISEKNDYCMCLNFDNHSVYFYNDNQQSELNVW